MPLVRGDSDASGRGFHTPDSPASPRGFHTPLSEPSAPPSPARPIPPTLPSLTPALPATSSQGGPPSPSSALMTVSLDAYLEPRRISFESPPSSDLLPRAQSPEESYPVFSPPPIRRRHTVASPSLLHRTSIISQSSRAEPTSHHTCNYLSTVKHEYNPIESVPHYFYRYTLSVNTTYCTANSPCYIVIYFSFRKRYRSFFATQSFQQET